MERFFSRSPEHDGCIEQQVKTVSAASFRVSRGDKVSDTIHALHYLDLKYTRTYVFFLSFCEDAQNYFYLLEQ